MPKGIQIAIDGPSASGKGTVSRAVASALGFTYLDSGALYRTVALIGERSGLSLDDGSALEALIAQTDVRALYKNGQMEVVVNGVTVGDAIRSEAVGQGASRVAKLPEVRRALLTLQRELAEKGGVVMDGRDIGTVVLKDAELKIYLTASVETRALRRHEEQLSRGIESHFDEVKKALIARDAQDINRAHAPLKKAEDACVVDSTDRSPDDVVAEIVRLAGLRMA